MITVYPLPPQLVNNPYLDQLYAPMATLGVCVRRDRPRYGLPRLLRERGPRILHLHFFDELTQRHGRNATVARSLGFVAFLAACQARGVRIVWTAHNLAPHERHHPSWAFFVYRSVMRLSSAVIAHSQAALDLLERRYGPPRRGVVIPHGSYIGAYGPPLEQASSRAQLGLPAAGPILLNLGALRPYKGVEDLLAAFATLPEAHRGRLLIAGAAKDPAYTAMIVSQAERISGAQVLPRFVPDDELPMYLAAADVVVLPYQSLLTSGMLLCALSAGRPVVAPAFGPVRELVREGEGGFLFTPGSSASLAAALARAVESPHRAAMGRAALAIAQQFDWPTIAARTAALYYEIAM